MTSLKEPMVSVAVAGFLAYSQVKTTSSAVKGWPSCQVTPFFSFQVTDLPSAASVPSSRPGIVSARTGRRLPSPSQPASGSQHTHHPSRSLPPPPQRGFRHLRPPPHSALHTPPPP